MLSFTKVCFAELVASLHREGRTASSYLQDLYGRYALDLVSHNDGSYLGISRYGYFQVGLVDPFRDSQFNISFLSDAE
jgi:hypothetical protein